MRWLLWALLLGNVLLLAYYQLPLQAGIEPRITQAPLHPEKIRLLNAQEIAALPQRTISTAPAMGNACYDWGTFSAEGLESAQSALSRYALNVSVRLHTAEEAARYWVYIPSLGSARQAQAKLAELRARGIDEMYVMRDPQWRHAISFGLFKDEQLADKLLQTLKSKGVDVAIKGVRNQESGRASLYISNLPAELVPELEKLQPEYPGSELKPVICQQEAL